MAAGRDMLEVDGVSLLAGQEEEEALQAESSMRKAAECHECQITCRVELIKL